MRFKIKKKKKVPKIETELSLMLPKLRKLRFKIHNWTDLGFSGHWYCQKYYEITFFFLHKQNFRMKKKKKWNKNKSRWSPTTSSVSGQLSNEDTPLFNLVVQLRIYCISNRKIKRKIKKCLLFFIWLLNETENIHFPRFDKNEFLGDKPLVGQNS